MNTTATRPAGRVNPARLVEILEASRALQAELLASIRARREAIRTANFNELARLERSEQDLASRLAQLDSARAAETAQLAARLAIPAKSPLGEIAARLPEADRARLDSVRAALRAAIEETARETGVLRQASERLSAHMAGVMQAVNSALAHAKVYSRGGVIAMGPNVVSSLDIKS
ncbi:MAG: hypothetical protein RIS45_1542 [Planctomycetota bacterium]|jgi:FlgN protein